MGFVIGAGLALVWACAVLLPFELLATAANAVLGPLFVVALVGFGSLRGRQQLGFGLIAVLFGSTLGTRWVTGARPAEVPQGTELTVVTYNVLFHGGDVQATVDLLAEQDADVIFLQEVTPEWTAHLVALAPHRVVAAASGSQGLAVLSRFPLSRSRLWFSERERMVGQCVDVAVAGRPPVGVCHVHLTSPSWALETSRSLSGTVPALEGNARLRRAQWARLEAEMGESHDPIVIGGDFNTLPTERVLVDARRRWVDAARDHAWFGAAPTWPQVAALDHRPPWLLGRLASGGPWFRIDYLLCHPSVAIREASRRPGGGSDHLPVRATLTLPAVVSVR